MFLEAENVNVAQIFSFPLTSMGRFSTESTSRSDMSVLFFLWRKFQICVGRFRVVCTDLWISHWNQWDAYCKRISMRCWTWIRLWICIQFNIKKTLYEQYPNVELDADSASKTNYNPFEWEIRLIVHIMNYAADFFSRGKKKVTCLIPHRTAEALISPTKPCLKTQWNLLLHFKICIGTSVVGTSPYCLNTSVFEKPIPSWLHFLLSVLQN